MSKHFYTCYCLLYLAEVQNLIKISLMNCIFVGDANMQTDCQAKKNLHAQKLRKLYLCVLV